MKPNYYVPVAAMSQTGNKTGGWLQFSPRAVTVAGKFSVMYHFQNFYCSGGL
jgi:hypothetical protein